MELLLEVGDALLRELLGLCGGGEDVVDCEVGGHLINALEELIDFLKSNI